MRKDEFIRPEDSWARRSLFGRPRRRIPWIAIALLLVLGGAGYALARNDLLPAIKDRWSRSWAPAKPAAAPERLSLLPLPAPPSPTP